MKNLKPILYVAVALLLSFGCEEEPVLYDFEKYKFVSFIDEKGEVLENGASYTVSLRYDGSVLNEDFTVNLKIAGSAKEGVDYNVESKTVLFKAGEIKSEPYIIEVIDNLLDGAEDLTLELIIESVSNPNIDIGVGILNQSNKSIMITILDNECPEGIDKFATELVSESDNAINATINGDVLSLTGNIINYGAFPNANLEITLTPAVAGAKVGSVTFPDFDAGTDNDGYVYQFRQVGEGTYDVCSGVIKVNIGVYYESGGSWVYWYTSNNVIKVP